MDRGNGEKKSISMLRHFRIASQSPSKCVSRSMFGSQCLLSWSTGTVSSWSILVMVPIAKFHMSSIEGCPIWSISYFLWFPIAVCVHQIKGMWIIIMWWRNSMYFYQINALMICIFHEQIDSVWGVCEWTVHKSALWPFEIFGRTLHQSYKDHDGSGRDSNGLVGWEYSDNQRGCSHHDDG